MRKRWRGPTCPFFLIGDLWGILTSFFQHKLLFFSIFNINLILLYGRVDQILAPLSYCFMAENESLLGNNNGGEVVLAERKSEATQRKTTTPSSCIVSLDVFRGLCVFVSKFNFYLDFVYWWDNRLRFHLEFLGKQIRMIFLYLCFREYRNLELVQSTTFLSSFSAFKILIGSKKMIFSFHFPLNLFKIEWVSNEVYWRVCLVFPLWKNGWRNR